MTLGRSRPFIMVLDSSTSRLDHGRNTVEYGRVSASATPHFPLQLNKLHIPNPVRGTQHVALTRRGRVRARRCTTLGGPTMTTDNNGARMRRQIITITSQRTCPYPQCHSLSKSRICKPNHPRLAKMGIKASAHAQKPSRKAGKVAMVPGHSQRK
jgi:hypothetical protein